MREAIGNFTAAIIEVSVGRRIGATQLGAGADACLARKPAYSEVAPVRKRVVGAVGEVEGGKILSTNGELLIIPTLSLSPVHSY